MILVDYVKCDPQMQPRVYDNLKQTQSAPNCCVYVVLKRKTICNRIPCFVFLYIPSPSLHWFFR